MIRRAILAGLLLGGVAAAGPALAEGTAERAEGLPKDLEGVGIDEHVGADVPLDLPFKDENGRDVTLGRLLRPERPAILTLNYYRCPMLCTLILNGLVQGMKDVGWSPGGEFDVITVSIDPTETPTLARQKKQSYIEEYGKPEAAPGWHFLTGPESSIRALASAVGFRYRFVPERNEYAHAAAIFALTPSGKISRYLYGVQFDGPTLRLALVEAGEGKVGSALDRFILYCYHYDATAGKYAPAALKIMQVGGALTVLVLGALLGSLWLRESRRRRAA